VKYLQTETHLGDAECAEDAIASSQLLEIQLDRIEEELANLPADAPLPERFKLELDAGYHLLDLDRNEEAWSRAERVFQQAVPAETWLGAVEACDIMYKAEQPESIRALAHGIWLSVTYPVDPELSVAMLQHLVDETPDHSDGGAVAAATAGYIVDMRAQDKQQEDLRFFTAQLMGQVARRHSKVEDQEIFDFWVERLELNEPAKFLPHLAKILDVITGDEWWFDRDELRGRIPAN
jgi:hypothetical protein